MLSGAQLCFQLLRIGSSLGGPTQDLYTFRPAHGHSVFRLGRAEELCDVTLDSPAVSRVHAELHAEREASSDGGEGEAQEEGWRVHIKDKSTHGTWVNEVRLQAGVLWELSDGDALTFGGHGAPDGPEFYFLFQKVKVRPLDFDAITIPKAGTFSSDLQNRIRTNPERMTAPGVDLSKLSINRSTVILNSIGSLSKMQGSAWTFRRSHSHEGAASDPVSSSPPRPPLSARRSPPSYSPAASSLTPKCVVPKSSAPKVLAPASRSRRKSAHTVLLEDDSSDEPRSRTGPEEVQRLRGRKKRRLYKSDSDDLCSPPPPLLSSHPRPQEAKPFPVGIRTIGSFHGAMTNSRLDHHVLPPLPRQERQEAAPPRHLHNTATFRQQRSVPPAPRGRRRANSAPVFSPLVVGGESYNLASPSVRVCAAPRGRPAFNRFHQQPGKRRGRPRKHPLPPRPSLPSPSSSSSSSTSTASSSSGSSSSSSSDEDDEPSTAVSSAGGSVEPCAAAHCLLPQQDPVQWIQCDVCDAWYHIDCLHIDRKKLLRDPNADFHCGCC
ncbi:transcription factor 19 [Corythoichthys intestinalis]|uniref:transcription factor 19 n=1 Tax=Corythoichthys intestinalis TaxID=161448 RepID=UPI0025A68995|nr:transcription factor 19 [Corythoichthys intestinalis]